MKPNSGKRESNTDNILENHPGPTGDSVKLDSEESRKSDDYSLATTIVIFLKGLLMGMADIIPGVSGGTMALITGIYERLIHAIRDIDFRFIYHIGKGNWKEAKTNIMKTDFALLVPLGIGIITAVVIFAKVINYFLDYHTASTYSFFLGLILASTGIVSKYVEHVDTKHIISGVVGFLFVFIIVGFDELSSNHSRYTLFFAGSVAICAMILPGISGSLILLIIGQYNYMLDVLNERKIQEMVVFVAGAFVGIVTFSRLLDNMIRNHKSVTMAFLFGLMLGALRVPAEEISGNTDLGEITNIAIIIFAAISGFAMVAFIELKSRQIEERLGIELDAGDQLEDSKTEDS